MLSALIWLPILGAGIIAFLPGNIPAKITRQISFAISIAAFIWSLVIAIQFNPENHTQQFIEFLPWIDSLGLSYSLGIDGLSLPLLVLNTLLTCIAIYSTDEKISRPRFYYSLVLLLNAGVSGAFLAQDLLLFFLFYELELVPLYFLIAIWGGARKGYAAIKFLLYTTVSGILLLAAFLGVVWFSGSSSFAYEPLRTNTLPLGTQLLLLGTILIAFGIKIPLVPLHTWLPDAHVEASTPISVLLAGVLLKLGTYGLLRFGLSLFPEAWQSLAPILAIWAVVSVLYGAFAAIAQTDMKKMVAYSSIAHMGYILLASAAATPLSLLGCVYQMISHGLISALLFLVVGVVYKKTGTRDINLLCGLLNPERGLPIIGSLMIVGVMASAGIPGMLGFISEFLIFRGSFEVFPTETLLSMIGTGLTSVYFLLLVNRVFFGRLSEKVLDLPQVQWSERLPAAILAGIIILFGIVPSWLGRWTEASTTAIINPQVAIAKVIPAASVSENRLP